MTAGVDTTVELWDAKSGKPIKVISQLQKDGPDIRDVCFSADGNRLAASTEKDIRIWNLKTGKLEKTLTVEEYSTFQLRFTPDGKTLATATSTTFRGKIQLWNVNTGKKLHQLEGHPERTVSLAFSTDGKFIYSSGGDGSVRKWDVATGKEAARYAVGPSSAKIQSMTLSPNGKAIITANSNRTIQVIAPDAK